MPTEKPPSMQIFFCSIGVMAVPRRRPRRKPGGWRSGLPPEVSSWRARAARAAHGEQIRIDAALLQQRAHRLGAREAQRQVGRSPPLSSEWPVSVTLVTTCRSEDMVASSFSSAAIWSSTASCPAFGSDTLLSKRMLRAWMPSRNLRSASFADIPNAR